MSGYELPEGWKLGSLCDIAEINPKTNTKRITSDSEISFIPMEAVDESGRIILNLGEVFEKVSKGYTYFTEKDVLFAKITPCMENGKGCYVDTLKNHIGAGSTEFHVLRAHDEKYSRFIFQHTISPNLRLKALRFMTGSAGQQRVQSLFFSRYPIQIPPPEEAKKIADVLTTIDNTIEKTEQLIEKLKNIKKGLMHDIFTRGVDENGQLRPSYDEAPHLYKESELGWIPKEWSDESIDSLSLKVGSGITPRGGEEVYKSEGIILLRSQNVLFNKLKLDNVAYIDNETNDTMKNSELKAHDILINITGASIGRCCYFPCEMPRTNVNQHVCSIRLKDPDFYNSKYITHFLCSYFGQNQIDRLNAGGNREGLNYKQLKSFRINWCVDEDERKSIVEKIESNSKSIIKEEFLLEKYREIKQGLIEDLLSGKVRVSSLLEKEESNV